MSEDTILLVDDEASILNALKRALRRESYRLLTASGGPEALEILACEPVSLVVVDQRMPNMTGIELLRHMKAQYPGVMRIILSGYAEASTIVEAINKGEIYRFIAKPWDDGELKLTIRQALEQHALQRENERLAEELRKQNLQLQEFNQKLESLVQERTTALELAQEIVEQFPDVVVGISQEGVVASVNRAGRRFFANQGRDLFVGADFTQSLPPPIVTLVQATLGSSELETIPEWPVRGEYWQLTCFPLAGRERSRGCVLLARLIGDQSISLS